ncbi:MAG TPA: PP2C family serine/threonine-protein phosphatase [Pseudonocardiaceae bacterium]|nr:PP2C family serine/threonine-protein phosphatase [Pseudonocardiaceae bacterium]
MTRSCPACGSPVSPADGFCEGCGRDLLVARPDWEAAVRERAATLKCESCGSAGFSLDGYCETCGTRAPSPRDHLEFAVGPVAGVTDRGRRGHTNEDAMAIATVRQPGSDWDATGYAVAVVCDGISTARRPETASLAAVEAGIEAIVAGLRSGEAAEAATRAGVSEAVAAVRELATHADRNNPPSCTFVSAVASEDLITVGWLGDSRAYWLDSEGGSACLTSDDSWAAHVIAAGVVTPEQAYADVRAHTLVRWIGADAPDVEPRVRSFRPAGPGVVLVCSDGLWNYLPGAGQLASEAMPQAATDPMGAARSLTRFALDAGGRDNITVVVVPVPPDRSPR